jgi:hypothetical protein
MGVITIIIDRARRKKLRFSNGSKTVQNDREKRHGIIKYYGSRWALNARVRSWCDSMMIAPTYDGPIYCSGLCRQLERMVRMPGPAMCTGRRQRMDHVDGLPGRVMHPKPPFAPFYHYGPRGEWGPRLPRPRNCALRCLVRPAAWCGSSSDKVTRFFRIQKY